MFATIREALSYGDVVKLLKHFEITPNQRLSNEKYLVFPTCCHNSLEDNSSHKLYYYKDSKRFRCYTECAETFDIIDLIKRIHDINYNEMTMGEAANFIRNFFQLGEITSSPQVDKDIFCYSKFKKRETLEDKTQYYDDTVLQAFFSQSIPEWTVEGIPPYIQRRFEIKYRGTHDQIVIPYRDRCGELVGVRVRNLTPDKPKYMPLMFEGKYYLHDAKNNLYGVFQNAETIQSSKTAILFEGEKSVLKCASFGVNIALAVGGSSVHKQFITILRDLGVKNVILAFDKEHHDQMSAENSYILNQKKAEIFSPYFNSYFLYDFEGLLDLKDSPIDKGYNVFKKLIDKKIKV